MSRIRKLVLAPLVLLAFLLGLVGDFAQHADELQLHVICPEHGEQVHVVVGANHAHARELRAAPVQSHDAGCQLAELGARPTPVLPPAIAVAFAPVVAPADLPTVVLPHPPARSPLEHAPKTSPPARA